MCRIDWPLFADMLTGIGTFLVGLVAVLTLFFQYGYKLRASKLEKDLMNIVYHQYMASEEGIVWSDYPGDAENIISNLARRTRLDRNVIKSYWIN